MLSSSPSFLVCLIVQTLVGWSASVFWGEGSGGKGEQWKTPYTGLNVVLITNS